MSKLRFTVVACSGEDPAFPARELHEHAASSKGYMTPKNCEYPQELVLRMQDGLCRLTQVQLLSHQTHIATKIELFLSRSASLPDASYQRLGYLTLKSNVESNYMARELKTVHIDNEAVLVKLVLHQCFINERNLYSQVGIMAINLCGESLEGLSSAGGELPNFSSGETMQRGGGGGGGRSVAKPQQAPNPTDDLAFDLRFDAKTAERIREIQIAKDKAVAAEDYDQAKRLKKMEEHLKSIGLQLARLEAQKREAVANEDYDLAKRIKDDIAMLEASANGNGSPTGSSPSPTLPGGSFSNAGRSASRSQVLPRAGAVAVLGAMGMSQSPSASSSNFSPRDMYPGDDRSISKKNNAAQFNEDSPIQAKNRRNPVQYDGDNDEDDEEPARNSVAKSGGSSMFRGIPDAEDLPEPEDLPSALEKENEELIGVIGLFLVKCFYSNLWNHRDVAIRKVTMDLESFKQDTLRVTRACSILIQSGASDRIAQVSLSAFKLLERLLVYSAKIRCDDMCDILTNTTTQLVNKLGEPQAKVRDEATSMLLRLSSAKNVGIAFVMSHVAKRSKKPLGIKFLHGRLLVIEEALSKFDLQPDTDFSVDGIMSFLEDTNSFGHQAKEVREAAKVITVALYLVVGQEVEGFLKSLRPKQQEEYQLAFEEAETARASVARSKAAPAQKDKPASIRPPADSRSQPHQGRQPAPQADDGHDGEDDDDESVDEYTCPFCGIVDDKFDSDRLDQHFWAECRMLTPCKMCGQVIEISGLNEHLLVECEMKKNHKECSRCGEAITVKFFDKHVGLNDCPPRPNPKKANRCPLCHEDVAPGKRGWKVHLLDEACPNNPRSL